MTLYTYLLVKILILAGKETKFQVLFSFRKAILSFITFSHCNYIECFLVYLYNLGFSNSEANIYIMEKILVIISSIFILIVDSKMQIKYKGLGDNLQNTNFG